MNILRGALNLILKRETPDDSSSAWERMARELKGCLFVLLALFELVSLTSYIPIDTFAIFKGRLDHVNNLGGIVGAMLGEYCLGMLGVAGYALVIVTLWIAVNAFRGISIRQTLPRLVSALFGIFLAAVSCQLLLNDQFPEASLFQGGKLGVYVGLFLKAYFNTAGALLLVLGAFVITLILSTGLSPSSMFRNLFIADKEEREEDGGLTPAPAMATVTPIRPSVPAPAPATAVPAKPARKRRAKKNAEDGLVAMDENAGESTGELNNGGDAGEPVDENAVPSEFVPRELIPFTGSYSLPSLRLMKGASNGAKKLSRSEIKENADKLCEHLLSFQITGEVVAVTQGPVLITYEFKPSAGIKLSKIANLQDDLGVVLGTSELRVVAPIPGKTVVGIEVPRPKSEVIALKDTLAEDEFTDEKKHRLPIALGKATDGVPVFADMAALPHLLVAGSTGSGKSVFVNSMIMSFLYRCTPQQLRMILVDPKMLELNVFDGIPHLISNVITDNTIAYNALNWAVWEMERRYALMAQTNSKNIDSFNGKVKGDKKLPFIVIVVDELADLMMSGGQAVEVAITRLAQKARAAGIHLVLATQRPSAEVLTGLIKANIPSRLSFKVPSGIDSRTVLDTSGAEELIGRGDSLMIRPGVPLQRIHGTFVTEDELIKVVKAVKDGKDYSKTYIDFRGGSIPD